MKMATYPYDENHRFSCNISYNKDILFHRMSDGTDSKIHLPAGRQVFHRYRQRYK